eukprot:938153-Pleurochrysis_carterae.AAC.1
MPSGRRKGPEKRSNTVLEASAGFEDSGMHDGRDFSLSERVGAIGTVGSPGGWSWPVSRLAAATLGLAVGEAGVQGKVFSSKINILRT